MTIELPIGDCRLVSDEPGLEPGWGCRPKIGPARRPWRVVKSTIVVPSIDRQAGRQSKSLIQIPNPQSKSPITNHQWPMANLQSTIGNLQCVTIATFTTTSLPIVPSRVISLPCSPSRQD